MQCPCCGADVLAENAVCQRCGQRMIPPSPTSSSPRSEMRQTPVSRPAPVAEGSDPAQARALPALERPAWVTSLAVLSFVGTGVFMLPVLTSRSVPPLLPAAVILGAAALGLALGFGLLRLRPWARRIAIAFAIVGLPWLFSIVILVQLLNPGTKILFSGRAPSDLDAEECDQVKRAREGAVTMIIAYSLIVALSMLVFAVIAFDSSLRAHMAANERSAVGQLRVIVSAEATYATLNSGRYDDLDCLMAPAKCIPGDLDVPPLLDPARFSEKMLSGYGFRFIPGPKPAPGAVVDPTKVSPNGVASFVVVAEPVAADSTGTRVFCGEVSGLVCQIASVDPQVLLNGCRTSCVADVE